MDSKKTASISYSQNQCLSQKKQEKTQIEYLNEQRINEEYKNILIFGIFMKKFPQDIVEKILKKISRIEVKQHFYLHEDIHI